jgi:hypothetical protein
MTFATIERVADAVLYEGYVLYPYRASSSKNRCRWQFGVLAPRSPHDDGEPWFSQTECVIHPLSPSADRTPPRLSLRVRFLRPRRTDTGWLEGEPHAIDVDVPPIAAGPFSFGTALTIDVATTVRIDADRCGNYVKLRIRLENAEPWRAEFAGDRDLMLERSLVGTHLLLGIEHATFVSLLEPPPDASSLVTACVNRHTWPVLAGTRSQRTVMLSSPIVLYDYPAVAAESQGDLFDATEIDEILSLRVLTMTDAEKEEARTTDPRARAILERIDCLTPEALGELHGAMRSADFGRGERGATPTDFFNPPGSQAPDEASVDIGERSIAKGSRVVLRPNRRADAMDMFLRDQSATVAGVYRDVDDRVYVAVTIDADPGASLHESFGRFFYFDPAEVEPLEAAKERA